MEWDEFVSLLSGLGPDTPLGRIVQIRSESEPKRIEEFTPDMRRIQADWREFRMQTVDTKVSDEKAYMKAMDGLLAQLKGIAGRS